MVVDDFIPTVFLQDSIANWLSEEMMRDGLELDQMDLSGDTPLHLAARAGRTKTAVSLLNLGASVNMKVKIMIVLFRHICTLQLSLCCFLFCSFVVNFLDLFTVSVVVLLPVLHCF